MWMPSKLTMSLHIRTNAGCATRCGCMPPTLPLILLHRLICALLPLRLLLPPLRLQPDPAQEERVGPVGCSHLPCLAELAARCTSTHVRLLMAGVWPQPCPPLCTHTSPPHRLTHVCQAPSSCSRAMRACSPALYRNETSHSAAIRERSSPPSTCAKEVAAVGVG